MHRSHPLLLVVATPLLLLAACSQTPASIEIDGNAPKSIETMDAIPLPQVVVKDKKGEPLKEQPPLDWSTVPDGIVQIAGGTVSPIKSGVTKLVARVKDSDVVLEHPLTVQLIDRITIRCEPESCRFAPGDRFRLRAEARSGDTLVEDIAFEWTSEAPAILEAVGGGEFRAKTTGVTKVQASARGIVAAQTITVESPVDQLLVICPNPPAVYVAPSSGDEAPPSCVVKAGETVPLVTEVRSAGSVIERRAAWQSTNPSYVEVSGGRVTGAQEGAAIVEARVENLLVSMPVEVRRSVSGRCEGSFQERFEATLDEEPALFACASPESVRCFERDLEKGKGKRPLTAVATLAAARKCCCVRVPPLASTGTNAASSDGGANQGGDAPGEPSDGGTDDDE